MRPRAIDEILDSYDRAWNEEDPERCLEHLRACLTDEGVYCDPTVEIVGSNALAEHIGRTRSAFGGFRIERTSGFEEHHGYERFTWRMTSKDDEPIVEGFDVVRLAADGRFVSILGFFDPFPGAVEEQSCDDRPRHLGSRPCSRFPSSASRCRLLMASGP
ncbi:MAG TPA: nuclear transport factor 2 family protein [Actinomycetota bacterium]|jgi:hypothetical protein